MIEREFTLTKNPVASLVRDLRRLFSGKKYEIDEEGFAHFRNQTNVKVGGVFDSWVMRHESVQRAIETGDKLAEMAARALLDTSSDAGYFRTMESCGDHNKIPDAGINFILNVILGSTSKVATWYHGPFENDWSSSFATGTASWAGALSGPLGTELGADQYDEGARVAAIFGDAAAAKSIAASAASRFTISTGESGITLYGSTLNNVATVAYNATDKVLLAAALFGSAKSGLGGGDKVDIEYSLTGSST